MQCLGGGKVQAAFRYRMRGQQVPPALLKFPKRHSGHPLPINDTHRPNGRGSYRINRIYRQNAADMPPPPVRRRPDIWRFGYTARYVSTAATWRRISRAGRRAKIFGRGWGKHSPFGGIGTASAPLGSSWQDRNRSRTAGAAARKHPCYPPKTPARTAVYMRHATHCRMPALWHPCQRRFPRKLPNGGRSFCFAIIFSGLLPTRQPGFPTRAPLRLPPCCRLAARFARVSAVGSIPLPAGHTVRPLDF